MRFPKPLEQQLDDTHSLLIPSARLKGGSPYAEVMVFNGVPIYQDEIHIAANKARMEFAKQVKSKVGIDEDITERALLIVSSNLTTTLAADLEADAANERGTSQATHLVELASSAEFFHTPDDDGFVTFEVNGHRETWPVKSKPFKRWLSQQYWKQSKRTASSQAFQDALAVLEAKAQYDGPELPVCLRVGGDDEAIYIDLGNDKWEFVKITRGGWQVISEPPIKFRRAKGLAPLPYPVGGNSIDELYRFVNITDSASQQLLNAWLIQSLMPRGPYPPLALHGQQGSAKSTSSSVLRSLIDPNTSPLRSEPRSEHDLIIAANNGWVVCLDNLSRLTAPLSDSLCRLATGGGFSARELYTDSDEVLFNVMRPVIINGIEEIISKGDLLDRTLVLNLPNIARKHRRAEKRFWAEFEEAKPRILGALYDAISSVMRELPFVVIEDLPRMADFACIGTAIEKVFGYEQGSFMKVYNDHKQRLNGLVIECEPVAEIVCAFIKEKGEWSGRAKDLLKELNEIADEKTQRLKGWPSQPQFLSNILRRLAPNLASEGVNVEFDIVGHKKTRTIFLKYVSPSSAPSADAESAEESQSKERTVNNDDEERAKGASSAPNDSNEKTSCSADGADGDYPVFQRGMCPTCGAEGEFMAVCPNCNDEFRTRL